MADAPKRKSWWKIALLLVVFLGAAGGAIGWYKFFREEPQPDWVSASPDMRFKYGSIGAEHDAGIPYWIFFVLPRMFPEKLPGPGGYASLGVAWEQGQELPIGFTKKVIGFPRVANNCASCHTASYRKGPYENPIFVPTGPNHTLNLQAFFRFVVDCAKDPRFNSDEIMREIELVYDLPFLDKVIYRYLLIPITKKRLLEREAHTQRAGRVEHARLAAAHAVAADEDHRDEVHAVAVSALRRRAADAGLGVDAEGVRLDVPAPVGRRPGLGEELAKPGDQRAPGRLRGQRRRQRLEPALHATVQRVVGGRLPMRAVRHGLERGRRQRLHEGAMAAVAVVAAVLQVAVGRQVVPMGAQRLQRGEALAGEGLGGGRRQRAEALLAQAPGGRVAVEGMVEIDVHDGEWTDVRASLACAPSALVQHRP